MRSSTVPGSSASEMAGGWSSALRAVMTGCRRCRIGIEMPLPDRMTVERLAENHQG